MRAKSTSIGGYPKRWRHKETKKVLRVTPWWEIPDPIVDFKELPIDKDIVYKFGMLVQVGWLLENEHGVWMGVGPTAAQHFEEIPDEDPKVESAAVGG